MPVFDLVILNQQRQQPKLLTLHFTLIKSVATPEDPILLLDNAPLPVGSSFLRCIHKPCKAHSI